MTAEGSPAPERHRLRWAILGALGTGLIALFVSFGSDMLNDYRKGEPVWEPAPGCVASWRPDTPGIENLDVLVSHAGANCWVRNLPASQESMFDVKIRYANFTTEKMSDVTLEAWLPEGVELVAASTFLKSTSYPEGKLVSDRILDPGINIGGYHPASVAYLSFTVHVTPDYEPMCGAGLLGIYARTWHPNVGEWMRTGVSTEFNC